MDSTIVHYQVRFFTFKTYSFTLNIYYVYYILNLASSRRLKAPWTSWLEPDENTCKGRTFNDKLFASKMVTVLFGRLPPLQPDTPRHYFDIILEMVGERRMRWCSELLTTCRCGWRLLPADMSRRKALGTGCLFIETCGIGGISLILTLNHLVIASPDLLAIKNYFQLLI